MGMHKRLCWEIKWYLAGVLKGGRMAFWNREGWGWGESSRQRKWGAERSQGEEAHDMKIKGGLEIGSHQETLS